VESYGSARSGKAAPFQPFLMRFAAIHSVHFVHFDYRIPIGIIKYLVRLISLLTPSALPNGAWMIALDEGN
jgi:hypothetical protein